MGFHPLYVEKVEKNGAFLEVDDKIVRKYPIELKLMCVIIIRITKMQE
jgi:hypothetical protein